MRPVYGAAMTLIAYAKCTDGQVLAVDRKESDYESMPSPVRKYYLPNNEQFVLALAGPSDMVDMIVDSLHSDQDITGETVKGALQGEGGSLFPGNVDAVLSGILMARIGGQFRHYKVAISNSRKLIVEDDPDKRCYGSGEPVAMYLMNKLLPVPLPWKETLPLVAEIVDEVAGSVDGVGSIDKYGMDAFVFTDDGEVHAHGIRDKCMTAGIECSLADGGHAAAALSRVLGPPARKPAAGSRMLKGTAAVAGTSGGVGYEIRGGSVASARLDAESASVVIGISAASRGAISATLPRRLIDARHRGMDDDFFVLVDGREAPFREARGENDRTVTVEFDAGDAQIEVIGTETGGGGPSLGPRSARPLDAPRPRGGPMRGPIRVHTDRSEYDYGSEIVIGVLCPYSGPERPIHVEILDESGAAVHRHEIPTSEDAGGRYQHVVHAVGEGWGSGSRYVVRCTLGDEEATAAMSLSPRRVVVSFDKSRYPWKGTVWISIAAPGLRPHPGSGGEIGGANTGHVVSLATGRGRLDGYRLVESRPGSGMFIGQVRLTGFCDPNTAAKGLDTPGSGRTLGSGPFDGRLACGSDDSLSVTIATADAIVQKSTGAGWTMGTVKWLKESYESPGHGVVRLYDPDIGGGQGGAGGTTARVTSGADGAGVDIRLVETGVGTGIYEGVVHFDPGGPSRAPVLRTHASDTVTVQYVEATPPAPHDPAAKILVESTVTVGPPAGRREAGADQPTAIAQRPRASQLASSGLVRRIDLACRAPGEVVVRPGQTVTWVNSDAGPHTVTSGTPGGGIDGLFDSGLVAAGSSFSHKFTRKGRYRYFCMLHPDQGRVVTVL